MDYVLLLRGKQALKLRWTFAFFGLGAMSLQLLFAALIFWRYGSAHQWHIPDAVISAYLGATVVQVVGLVLVMTQSLFPKHEAEG